MHTTTRISGNAPGLPGGTLTRRRLLRSGAVRALGLGLGFAACLPAKVRAVALSPADARLIALADRAEALERACDAHTAQHRGRATDDSEDAFATLASGFATIEGEMAGTPADTMAGIVAKARTLQVETCRNCAWPELGNSLADDIWRLFGGGVSDRV